MDAHIRQQISKYARHALIEADVLGQIPTPLADITAVRKLGPVETLFDEEDLPPHLVTVARRLTRRVVGALAIPERTIYVARDQCAGRQRFTHGHELAHDILPWHQAAYFGDDELTLRPETNSELDIEANLFSADLNFQLDGFTRMADDYVLGLDAPIALADTWGMSIHATAWRYVEKTQHTCALLVLGRFPVVAPGGGRGLKILQGIESPSFRGRYGSVRDRFPEALSVENTQLGADAFHALSRTTQEIVTHGLLRIDGAG